MHYYQLGKIPKKRHTTFRKEDGSLYSEQLISTEGFSNIASLTYHIHPPTLVKKVEDPINAESKIVDCNNMLHRSYLTWNVAPEDDFLKSRKLLLLNNDVKLGMAAPKKSPDYFYKNADADEVLFIHKGSGTLHTMYGTLPFGYGDYLVIPRGTIYQFEFDSEENKIFTIESTTPIKTPKRYRNEFGQLLEHSPFCERDLRKPEVLETYDMEGDYLIYIKKGHNVYPYTYATHPFDIIGWDGCVYPYAFNIKDFEPITGRIHQPPPVHQTFEANNFVICCFVPRRYDYHPESIPAPYNHSNVDSDEVLYYVEGEFMSRKYVEEGMITLHPLGIPHGPHPGTVEKSIGQKGTEEYAVMVDTFYPLWITEEAVKVEIKDYHKSWIE